MLCRLHAQYAIRTAVLIEFRFHVMPRFWVLASSLHYAFSVIAPPPSPPHQPHTCLLKVDDLPVPFYDHSSCRPNTFHHHNHFDCSLNLYTLTLRTPSHDHQQGTYRGDLRRPLEFCQIFGKQLSKYRKADTGSTRQRKRPLLIELVSCYTLP